MEFPFSPPYHQRRGHSWSHNQRQTSFPKVPKSTIHEDQPIDEYQNILRMPQHPLLIEEVMENVMKYLPTRDVKNARQVCLPWFDASKRLWGKCSKIRLRNVADVERFVADFEVMKGANRANHLPLPFSARQFEIDRADHIYKFPVSFFNDFGKYFETLVLKEPRYIGGPFSAYHVNNEDIQHFGGGVFYNPLANDELLEILSSKMPNLKDLTVKFRPTSGERLKDFIFVHGLNQTMGTMMNLQRLSVREFVRSDILENEEWELSDEIEGQLRLEELSTPEERFLHAMLHNAPNLETLKIRMNTVRKEMVLSSLIFSDSVNLPKLKHLPSPISINREIIQKMKRKRFELETMSLKLGIFSEDVSTREISEMFQNYEGTLENLKLIIWQENFRYELPLNRSLCMAKVNTLELWGFEGPIEQIKKFTNLKRFMLGSIPFGFPEDNIYFSEEVSATLPGLDEIRLAQGFNASTDSEMWRLL